MANRLAGKVAVVTGGASGIGEATCRLFAKEGARGVVIADLNEAAGTALEAELNRTRSHPMFRHLDVTQAGQWAETVEPALARYGRLDVLAKNAGRGADLLPARQSSTRPRTSPGPSCSRRRTNPPTRPGASWGLTAA